MLKVDDHMAPLQNRRLYLYSSLVLSFKSTAFIRLVPITDPDRPARDRPTALSRNLPKRRNDPPANTIFARIYYSVQARLGRKRRRLGRVENKIE
jgi:hypothetical protein